MCKLNLLVKTSCRCGAKYKPYFILYTRLTRTFVAQKQNARLLPFRHLRPQVLHSWRLQGWILSGQDTNLQAVTLPALQQGRRYLRLPSVPHTVTQGVRFQVLIEWNVHLHLYYQEPHCTSLPSAIKMQTKMHPSSVQPTKYLVSFAIPAYKEAPIGEQMERGVVTPPSTRGQGGTGRLCVGRHLAMHACQLQEHNFRDCVGAQRVRCILQHVLPSGVILLPKHVWSLELPMPAFQEEVRFVVCFASLHTMLKAWQQSIQHCFQIWSALLNSARCVEGCHLRLLWTNISLLASLTLPWQWMLHS